MVFYISKTLSLRYTIVHTSPLYASIPDPEKKTEEAAILGRSLDWDPCVAGGLDGLMFPGATVPTHHSSCTGSSGTTSNLFLFYFIYLFLAALGLHCCAWAFSSCNERGLLFIAVRGLLIAVASLVAKHGL